MPLRFIPDDINIDFIGKRFFAYAVSLLLIVGTIFLLATKGLNFGIDFTGGTVIEIGVSEDPDMSGMRTMLNDLDLGGISLQEFGDPRDLLIRMPQQEGGPEAQQEAINKIRAALDAEFGEEAIDYRRTEFVGPQVGKELQKTAIIAVLLSLGSILCYLWFRFEWQFGVSAILATAHDVFVILGFFALTQIQFDLSTLAAILLVAGYSINDTVVVFDRIRENLRKYKKMPLADLLNRCVNQTLSRTTLTSCTTLLALVALSFFGGEVISGFVDALIFGIILGTFSSVYVASPLLLYLNLRRPAEEVAVNET